MHASLIGEGGKRAINLKLFIPHKTYLKGEKIQAPVKYMLRLGLAFVKGELANFTLNFTLHPKRAHGPLPPRL